MNKTNHPSYVSSRVTAVLLTYNCADWIERTLTHVLAMGVPVVAVDNASADGTADIIARHPEIELIRLPKNIGAAARNYAVERATTPYVVFCDDDIWYERDSLEHTAGLMDKYDQLAVVTGRILVGEKDRLDGISTEMAASPVPDRHGLPGAVLISFMGGASMMRRKAFLEAGGYDPRFFMGGEEQALAWKLLRNGWQMRYIPALIVHHYPSAANAPSIRHLGLRNTIWTHWLNRPARHAISHTWKVVAGSRKDKVLLKGLLLAVKGAPWVIRERQTLPVDVESDIRMVETAKKGRNTSYGTQKSDRQPRATQPTPNFGEVAANVLPDAAPRRKR